MSIDHRVGAEFAGYRIESVIGHGGMSVVYLAEHLRLKRKVALKIVAPNLAADERFRQRFLRESELAASLDHPNVVPIYDADSAGGELYIAMRYVEGKDLKEVIRSEGALEPQRTVALLAQAASALDAAHARGLVHRDVKPANMLITRLAGPNSPEHVYLSDFGLTKRLSSDSGITGTGQFVGTLDYAAPEQFEGKPLDPRTDVYSLGCVLYECLTAEVPFVRNQDAALMYAHLMSPPPSVTDVKPDLPVGIDAVVKKAMAKSADDRHASAGALIEEARRALPSAVATDAFVPAGRPMSRRTVVALIAASIVLLSVAVGAVLLARGGSKPFPAPSHSLGAASLSGDVLAVIDPSTYKVSKRLPFRGIQHVQLGAGGVWVGSDAGISRLDPQTFRVTNTLRTPITRTRDPYDFIVAGPPGQEAIWATGFDDPRVLRIDPLTLATTTTIAVGQGPDGLAYGAGAIWVSNYLDDSVSEIDSATNKLVRTIRLGADMGPVGIVVGADAVWVVDFLDASVAKIDTRNGRVMDRIPVGQEPQFVAVTGDAVWVTNQGDGTLSRIDPRTDQAVTTVKVGGEPVGVAVGGGAVWVTNGVDGTVAAVFPATNSVAKTIGIRRKTFGIAHGIRADVAVGYNRVWVAFPT